MYIKNDELDLEKIIDEFSGYVYKIIKNMAILYTSVFLLKYKRQKTIEKRRQTLWQEYLFQCPKNFYHKLTQWRKEKIEHEAN